jgi:uncharacterized secreted protein with C-terminal beta-propeller domain
LPTILEILRLKIENNHNPMYIQIKRMIMIISVFAALISSFSASAQSSNTPTDNLIYIEASSLTSSNFSALKNKLKQNPNFEIHEACVPAKVFTVTVKTPSGQTPQQNFTSFNQIAQTVGINDAQLKATWTDENFMSKCNAARYGR